MAIEYLKLFNEDELGKTILEHINGYSNEENIIFPAILLETELDDSRKNKLKTKLTFILRAMSNFGFGKFIIGRHGKPTRFILSDGITLNELQNLTNQQKTEKVGT